MRISTIRELLKALPNDVEIDQTLVNNLAILELALERMVTITGVVDGKLKSVNTAAGREALIDQQVKDLRENSD